MIAIIDVVQWHERVGPLSSYRAHHYSRRRRFQSFVAGWPAPQFKRNFRSGVESTAPRGPIERDSAVVGDGSAALTVSRVTIGLAPAASAARSSTDRPRGWPMDPGCTVGGRWTGA